MTVVWVYIFSHMKNALLRSSLWRFAQCPEFPWAQFWTTNIRHWNSYPSRLGTIHREIMSSPDTACHNRSPGIFTEVAMEAFYLQVGREIKLLFEQLTQQSSIEKEAFERCRTGKEYCSAFTRIRQLLVLLLNPSTSPVLWHEEKGKKIAKGGGGKAFQKEEFHKKSK